jgi:hypothetical protein
MYVSTFKPTHPSYKQTYSVHPNFIDEEMEWMDREIDTHPWLVTMKKDHLFYMETL